MNLQQMHHLHMNHPGEDARPEPTLHVLLLLVARDVENLRARKIEERELDLGPPPTKTLLYRGFLSVPFPQQQH